MTLPGPASIRVATWNLWWRFGEWQERERAILATLQDVNADVIGLQEVWSYDAGDLASRIGDALNLHRRLHVSPQSERWQRRAAMPGVGHANAVLSRWPIIDVEAIPLPTGDAPDEGRSALGCLIQTPFGRLPFTTTHLNAGWAQSSIRTAQLTRIGQWIVKAPQHVLPPVLVGDLNAADDFDEIRALSGKRDALVPGLALMDTWWATNPGDPGHTWDPAGNPLVTELLASRIDYIFVGFPTGRAALRPTAARRFGAVPQNSVWPSDHYGVVVDLEVSADVESR